MESTGPQHASSPRTSTPRRDGWIAVAVSAAFAVWLAATIPDSPAMGWDESMHAELPAARFALALRAGEIGRAIDVLLACDQYPPFWPALLGVAQAVLGVGEHVGRVMASLAWGGALAFVWFVARGAARETQRVDARTAGWAALAIAMLCPLAASFAGTLFLEAPSALATAFALWAWARRRERTDARADLVAGLAVTIALFTKWNYGLLLGAALALDWAIELVVALRGGRARAALARTVPLLAIPVVACAWWFVLPLPGGLDLAREHRDAFAGFLGGNLEAQRTSAAERVLYVATGVAPTVRMTLLALVLALCALRCIGVPRVRAPALAAVVLLGAPLAHPFFLDRFLVPGLVAAFVLAGIGLALVVPREGFARTATLGLLTLSALVDPGHDGGWLAERLGRLPEAEPARSYVLGVLEDRARIGPKRRLPTAGLERAEQDAFLDLVAAEARAGERVGWLGTPSEMSPAVVQLGLLARGRDASWFAEHDPPEQDLSYFGVDPGFDDAEVLAYANRFDVIVWTDPIDLRERRERAWVTRVRERLVALRPSDVREIGAVTITRPMRAPLDVRLFACRRTP